MKDMKGHLLHEGCKVARAVVSGRSPYIQICTVTRIEDDKIYLDGSKQAIRIPSRLLIVEQDPLYQMIKKYEDSKNL